MTVSFLYNTERAPRHVTDVVIPPNLTVIESYAFTGCTSLTSVTMPPTITTIEGSAFCYCTSLSAVTIPPSLRLIWSDTFWNCPNLETIELHPSLPCIIIKYGMRHYHSSRINEKVGTLYNVFNQKPFFPLSKRMYKLITNNGNDTQYDDVCDKDAIFVNWKVYSQKRNEQGRLLLYTALEQGVRWSNGLREIWEGNRAAIEEVDTITGLEAFMMAAVERNSSMETVYKLLIDHPGAINPYVRLTQQLASNRKRKVSNE